MLLVLLFFLISVSFFCVLFFFFQAEDGIRDRDVTGVQTCALPISSDTTYREALDHYLRLQKSPTKESSAKLVGSPNELLSESKQEKLSLSQKKSQTDRKSVV